MRRPARLLASLPFLVSCAASQVPRAISDGPVRPLAVAEVQRDPGPYIGREVRWGGSIIGVRNRERTTEIEVLSRPLDADGEPRGEEPGQGRFIALLQGFADPAEYPPDRLLTVTGRVLRVDNRPVGEYPYSYPVVAAENRYLWPEPPPPPPPYFYPDPWYHPWYRPWYGPWYH